MGFQSCSLGLAIFDLLIFCVDMLFYGAWYVFDITVADFLGLWYSLSHEVCVMLLNVHLEVLQMC